MAFPSRTFVDYQGVIPAEWLNAVDDFCTTGGSDHYTNLYVDNIYENTTGHGINMAGIAFKGGELNFGALQLNSSGLIGSDVILTQNTAANHLRLVANSNTAGTVVLSAVQSAGPANLKLQATNDVSFVATTVTLPNSTTFVGPTPPSSAAAPTLPDHLTNHKYVEEHLTLLTGILNGCEYSVVMGGTTFSITAGTARIVENNYPNPETHTDYVVPAFTNVADNYPTSGLTVVGVQLVGGVASLVQQNTDFTDAQRLTIAPICILAKSAGVIIAAASLVVPSYASGRLALDLYRALGPVCTGLSYVGSTGQTLARSQGTLFRVGGNYLSNKTLPNTVTLAAQTPVQFASYSRNNSNTSFTNSSILTAFDPSKYDNGGASTNGVPTGVVTANKWQAVRVWISSNGYSLLQYGTAIYNTSDEAISGVTTENFYAAPITSQLPFRGLLIVRGGATNFSLTADAVFINAGKLGDASSASAGSAIGNVQIQFKNAGTDLGTAGTVNTVNFTSGLTASRSGDTITVTNTVVTAGSWVPTISTTAGTLTQTTVGNCVWRKTGDLVTCFYSFIIVNNGTGSGTVKFTLPFARDTSISAIGVGRETQLTGRMLQAFAVGANSTEVWVANVDSTYAGGNGYWFQGEITYIAAP